MMSDSPKPLIFYKGGFRCTQDFFSLFPGLKPKFTLLDPEGIIDNGATLRCKILSFGILQAPLIDFEYRKINTQEWTNQDIESIRVEHTNEIITYDVRELDIDAKYEYRIVIHDKYNTSLVIKSVIKTFETSSTYIEPPLILVPEEDEIVSDLVTIFTDDFSVNNGEDTHVESEYFVEKDGNIIFREKTTQYLTEYTLPSETIEENTGIYQIYTRHRGDTYGWSPISDKINVISDTEENGDITTPIYPTTNPETASGPIFYQVTKAGSDQNSGQFYDIATTSRGGAGDHNLATGSWSGWQSTDIHPLFIPYDCKITHAHINFRGVQFDWREDPGSIYLDIGFIDHGYNTTINERILRFELEGDFEGGSIDYDSYRFSVPEDKITSMLGDNFFTHGEIIGVLMRTSTSIPGRIYSISFPFHLFCLKATEL